MRTSQSEYTFPDDAPSFTLFFANRANSSSFTTTDPVEPRRAERPQCLFARARERRGVGFFMNALQSFAVFIDHPSLYLL